MQKRPVSRKSNTLSALLRDRQLRNRWVRSNCLDVYVRKGKHFVHDGNAVHIKSCLMVANWGLKGCRHRNETSASAKLAHFLQLVNFMKEIERSAVGEGYDGVFVECVSNENLHQALRNHGYREVSERAESKSKNFYKPTARIVTQSPWVLTLVRPIHDLQRASLRGYLRDSFLDRFWICDQPSGLKVLLTREWIQCYPHAAVRRLSIIDLFHSRSETSYGWAVYWQDDRNLILSMLSRVEAHAFDRGFSEIALSRHVIFPGRRGQDVSCQFEDRDLDFELERRNYLSVDERTSNGIERYYLKRRQSQES